MRCRWNGGSKQRNKVDRASGRVSEETANNCWDIFDGKRLTESFWVGDQTWRLIGWFTMALPRLSRSTTSRSAELVATGSPPNVWWFVLTPTSPNTTTTSTWATRARRPRPRPWRAWRGWENSPETAPAVAEKRYWSSLKRWDSVLVILKKCFRGLF